MPVEIVMPKLGLTMTEGIIIEWKKKEGDLVRKGDIIFVLETEKVTYEVESPGDGILAGILVQERETVPVGAVVGYLLAEGEDPSVLKKVMKAPPEAPAAVQELQAQPSGAPATSPQVPEETGAEVRVKASPMAKKIAAAHGLDLRKVRGTGPRGRIIKVDVEEALQKPPVAAAVVEEVLEEKLVPFTGMRRAIAKKMLASKVETAQTYMSNTVDASRIVQHRKRLLPYIEENFGVRVTITDIMMKITSSAILRHPIMNTRWTENGVLYLKDIHMGMAMALDEGLIVPVIKNIDKKTLARIAKDRLELIQKGKENRFLPDDITGSTFTLSSMGMFGVEQFTANINLPENAILAVGAIIEKPVVVKGEVVVRPMVNVTLTYDHRTIDGAEAGKFMRTLKMLIEDPVLNLA